MDNHKYVTLSEAAEVAVTRCDRWRFETSDDFYDIAYLQSMAQVHDEEACVDEDSFYVVTPEGAIGFVEDNESIDWLFIPVNSSEDLPFSLEKTPEVKFCKACGRPVTPGARFCASCGAKLFP